MPCNDYGYSIEHTHAQTKDRLNKLTLVACKALEDLERLYGNDLRLQIGNEAADWWETHKAADARAMEKNRQIEEDRRKRGEAIAKLTLEERTLLGIKVR
jgi:hypothetical protein